jgi:hypothetical protein
MKRLFGAIYFGGLLVEILVRFPHARTATPQDPETGSAEQYDRT